MNKISPSEFNKAVLRLKQFSDNSGDVSGFKVSDELFVLYNPIVQLFAFSTISSEEEIDTFEFDGEILSNPLFVYNQNSICKIYNKEFYEDRIQTGNKKLDVILRTIASNDLLIYILILVFMSIGPILTALFKLVGGAAAFLSLFTFFIGVGLFAIKNNKK